MPEVRRNEKIDMAARGVAAESGWLLHSLEGLSKVRAEREPETELCSVAELLRQVDARVRPIAADRRNACVFENEAGELWLLADAGMVVDSASHFVSSLCLAVEESHITVRVWRRIVDPVAGTAELCWTMVDDARQG